MADYTGNALRRVRLLKEERRLLNDKLNYVVNLARTVRADRDVKRLLMKEASTREPIGDKMIKAGLVMLALPDPVSDVVGSVLAGAGLLANNLYKPEYGVKDLTLGVNELLSEYRRLVRELSALRVF